MARLYKSSHARNERFNGKHRFEHWYRDNTLYFITARCRDRYPAFGSERAEAIFWDRFEHWAAVYGFIPWITTLMDNHYHTIGYLRVGRNLGPFMQRFHGSVAKLVNDTLDQRHTPFWRNTQGHDYFDGCLRDPVQSRRAYRYTWFQARRAGICADPNLYPHTRVRIALPRGVRRASQLGCFLPTVPYQRYAPRAGACPRPSGVPSCGFGAGRPP
jgi:REP element-mobilizing transposase RayT